MTVDIISFSEGSRGGVLDLNPSIFFLDNRPDILKRVYLWQMSNRRLGTHNSKGISEISGTTAKPYRQKHTGRARQGSLRSPQFRGGAVIFGPKNRSHSYNLNKKIRNLGIKVALSLKRDAGQLLIFDNFSQEVKKTKDFLFLLSRFNYKSYLMIGQASEELLLSSRNASHVKIIVESAINVVDILSYQCVILTVDAIKYLEDRLL